MNDSTRATSPLRQRMMEDMRLRKLAPHTQAGYLRAVPKLASYLRRSPDTATVEDLRNFQLHLVDCGTSPITLNATITGLKFFFGITLDRAELMSKMRPVFVPRTLPVVLSREEVSSLIATTHNLKHQTALSVAYGAGLRASEVAALKVGDVDSTRMTLRIQQGKGGKDRYAMLSPVMLDRPRTWWRVPERPGSARMRCDVTMNEPATVILNDDKHIQKTKGCRHGDEEVAGNDSLSVQAQESRPTQIASGSTAWTPRHVFIYRSGRHPKPEFQQQFVRDTFLAP